MSVIDPVFLHTPQYRCESLEMLLGCKVLLKVETINPIRSFKGRGTSFLISQITDRSPLVCASAGNFGLALAYVGRKTEIPAIVFASHSANPLKLQRIRETGGEVRLSGNDFEETKIEARLFAKSKGLRFVEDTRDVATCEGAGTIAVELFQRNPEISDVLAALGNGALLTGVARWTKHFSPGTRVIGVSAMAAPAMAESWKTGRAVEHGPTKTIADGIAVRTPLPEALQDMTGYVDEVLTVEESSIVKAMRLVHEHTGIVLEPSGAVALAAIMENRVQFEGRQVALILCGGNLTPDQMERWLG